MPEEGVQRLLYQAVLKCDPALRNDLLANIVLDGNSTHTKGFKERLQQDVLLLAGHSVKIEHTDMPKGHAAWVGGAIVASLESFQSSWINKAEYDENGPVIFSKNC